jgi:hypothetical protein
MPYDVTFNSRAAWPTTSEQGNYELGNLGMEEAQALFAECPTIAGQNVELSRVWATFDETDYPRGNLGDGRRAFFVNVVVRVDADEETAATMVPDADDAALFAQVSRIMLDDTCEIWNDWSSLGAVEAPHRGLSPTARMPGM